MMKPVIHTSPQGNAAVNARTSTSDLYAAETKADTPLAYEGVDMTPVAGMHLAAPTQAQATRAAVSKKLGEAPQTVEELLRLLQDHNLVVDPITTASMAPHAPPPPVSWDGGDASDQAYVVEHKYTETDPLLSWIDRNRNKYGAIVNSPYLIENGCVGFVSCAGQIDVVSPGRRSLKNPYSRWIGKFSVNDELISVGNILIFVRIFKGEIGLALQNGHPVLLEEGRHMIYASEMSYIGKQRTTENHITWAGAAWLNLVRVRPGQVAFIYENGVPKVLHHRTQFYELVSPNQQFAGLRSLSDLEISMNDAEKSLVIVRVPPGMLGLAWDYNYPTILEPSNTPYELRAPRYRWVKLVNMLDQCISIDNSNSLDIVRVKPGQLGLVWDRQQPRVLVPREEAYVLRKPDMQWVSLVNITDEHITLGSLHIITIPTGKRGVIWVRGQAHVIEAGQRVFLEEHFTYAGSRSMLENQYQLGPFVFVRVGAGQVGKKYTHGRLEILTEGSHCISIADGETFEGFVSTQEQVMRFQNLKARTLDNVDVKVDAVLTFRIVDPIKAIRDVRNLEDLLRLRSETTISNIFSHNNFGDRGGPPQADNISSSLSMTVVDPSKANSGVNNKPAVGVDANVVHTEFLNTLQTTGMEVWGVNLSDLSVENITVVNIDLIKDLEQRAVATVKTDTARATAQNQARVRIIEAESDARSLNVRAQAEYERKRIEAESEAKRVEIAAQAKATATRIEAEADAAAIIARAEARKRAMELESEGTRLLDANAMALRAWEAQTAMIGEMFRSQRTFVDTREMPSMAEMLQMNLLTNGGILGNIKRNGKALEGDAQAQN